MSFEKENESVLPETELNTGNNNSVKARANINASKAHQNRFTKKLHDRVIFFLHPILF